jgi:hypothetical protein
MRSKLLFYWYISNQNYFPISKFNQSAFILLLTVSSILFSSCNKEVFYTKKAYFQDKQTIKSNYIVFNRPYLKKKPTVFNRFLKLSIGVGTGYYFYLYPEQFLEYVSDPSIIGAATGITGFTISSAILGISSGGRKAIQICSNKDKIEWMKRYNKKHKNKYIYIQDIDSLKFTSIKTIPKDFEFKFIPENFNDIKNYHSVFPLSTYNFDLIKNSIPILSKEELYNLIDIFSDQSEAIFPAKLAYISLAKDEFEFKAILDQFQDLEPSVEKKYAEIISTFDFASDFIMRYRTSSELESVIEKTFKSASKDKLIQLLKMDLAISEQFKDRVENRIIDLSEDLTKYTESIQLYEKSSYPIKPIEFTENYKFAEKICDVLSIRLLHTDQPKLISNVINQVKVNYMRNQAKLFEEESIAYFEFIKKISHQEWLADSSIELVKDSILFDYLELTTEDSYFTGGYSSGKPDGYGVLYLRNGKSFTGNFIEGILDGKSIERHADGMILEGDFVKNSLHGVGKVTHSNGIIQQGNFVDGDQTGLGEIIYNKGDVIKGFFYGNKLNGIGERINADSSKYTGYFLENKFSGQGKYSWNSNFWFEGEFKENKRNGKGILHYNEVTITGIWKDDCPVEVIIVKDSQSEISNPLVFEDCADPFTDFTIDHRELIQIVLKHLN